MKVFISYSTTEDQIIALRLQTLGAVNGLIVYVPPASTRRTDVPELSTEVRQHLVESEIVLAVMMQNPTPSALSEMKWALNSGKPLIPIVGPLVEPAFYEQFTRFFLDRNDPSHTESAIVAYLAGRQQSEASKTAILALSTIAVGLALFWSPKPK